MYPTLRRLKDDILDVLLQEEDSVPEVAGPSRLEAATSFLAQLRAGTVDRTTLGEDFVVFLSPERVDAASSALTALGELKSCEVERTSERGGMEVTAFRFQLGERRLTARMFRTPDGKIQQFMIYRP